MLGNDYEKLVQNEYFDALLNDEFSKLVTWSLEDAMKMRNNSMRYKMSVEHKTELMNSVNLIRHASV